MIFIPITTDISIAINFQLCKAGDLDMKYSITTGNGVICYASLQIIYKTRVQEYVKIVVLRKIEHARRPFNVLARAGVTKQTVCLKQVSGEQ